MCALAADEVARGAGRSTTARARLAASPCPLAGALLVFASRRRGRPLLLWSSRGPGRAVRRDFERRRAPAATSPTRSKCAAAPSIGARAAGRLQRDARAGRHAASALARATRETNPRWRTPDGRRARRPWRGAARPAGRRRGRARLARARCASVVARRRPRRRRPNAVRFGIAALARPLPFARRVDGGGGSDAAARRARSRRSARWTASTRSTGGRARASSRAVPRARRSPRPNGEARRCARALLYGRHAPLRTWAARAAPRRRSRARL